MKTSGLTARSLRIILFFTMILIVAAAIGGFYFMQSQLRAYATQISQLEADAQAGSTNVDTLSKLKNTLDENSATIEKTKNIVAQSKQYQYQDQIVSDLTRIGAESNVQITGFDFSATSSAAAPTTPAPAAAQAAPTTPTPAASGAALKSQTVTVTFDTNIKYDTLMNFIKNIESNPLKMQIASVSMTKGEGDEVSTQSFQIEVYVV